MEKKLKAELDAMIAAHKPRNKSWTAQEDETLRYCYNKVPAAMLAEKLGRTLASLHYRARAMGVARG